MSFNHYSGAMLLLLAAGSVQAAAPVPGKIFCCEGGRICADSLPEQCRGKAYRILDSGGNLLKEVGPPLSAEQKMQQAAEERRRKELEEHAKELRRQDQALLDTYASLQDIDLSQQKAEGDITITIKEAAAKIEEATRRRKKFESEAEFYKKKTLPADVAKGLNETSHEIKTQQEVLTVKRADFETIKAKYDADRKRYIELTGAKPGAPSKGIGAPGR